MLKMLSKKNEENILELKEYGKLPLLKYPLLEQTGIVEHCFTTRLGGVSEGVCSSLNLSFSRGDDPEAVMENYRRVAETFGKTVDDFVCTDQTHTTNVLRVGREHCGYGVTKEKPYTDVDGLITNEPGVILSTFYADCVPLYFVDPVNKAIGLSHSGWRGTFGRMGQKTLDAMKEAFGTKPEDVYVAIGPSICQDCYEISEEVASRFREGFWQEKAIKTYCTELYDSGKYPRSEYLLPGKIEGKWQLDLWLANYAVLRSAGIPMENISITDVCTCCNAPYLFSHRATGGKRGNLGAFLMIKG